MSMTMFIIKLMTLTAHKAELMDKWSRWQTVKTLIFYADVKLQIIEHYRRNNQFMPKPLRIVPDADLSKYQRQPTTYWKLG